MGRFEGQTTRVAVAIDGFIAVDTTALISDLPPGISAVIGKDVLGRAVRTATVGQPGVAGQKDQHS